MRLVALDLGTTTACVVSEPDMPLITMIWDLRVLRGESDGMRFLRFRNHLREILDGSDQETVVAYELPAGAFKNGAAAEVIYGLVTEVKAVCTARSIEYTGINPSTVKQCATGKGGGKGSGKKEVLAAARERWPDLDVADHNLADALFVLECARAQFA